MGKYENESIDVLFAELDEAAIAFESRMHNLRNSMESKQIDLHGSKGVGEGQIFDYLHRGDIDKKNSAGDIADILRSAMSFSELVRQLLHDEPTRYQIKLRRETDYHRVAERRKWSSWWQRSARWTLGAFLVFLLYSFAVSLSEANTFFHVPIHDWLKMSGS